ncbi:alpha/beta fold hydrolase [Nakamurella panacisegetis]|uniref:alpha/beta fold hydrolase n=1 Tax=Nakamurella panacisegetis TaxID=1090615 RepID=UPI0018D407E5|nr:alpha/beta fold hydrolase [Nakamurella panacisegetis]
MTGASAATGNGNTASAATENVTGPRATGPSEAGVTEQYVDSDGVRINVACAGHGRPVLLLHGFPDSWHLWSAQINALAANGFQVIAPDLRGFGASDHPEDVAAYRMPLLHSDITAVLAHFGVERAAVVGHDWGAGIAWSFAMRHPAVVERLSVLSVGHPGAGMSSIAQRQLSWYMLWFLTPGVAEAVLPQANWQAFREWAWSGANTDPLMDAQIAALARPGALTAALGIYRANIRPETFYRPTVPPMPHVACPTMGVWSTGDLFLTREQMVDSAAFVDGPWRYEEVPGGHWIPAQAPDQLSALLLDFLA